MNLISVYVAVGAISFVKCELDYNSVIPIRSRQQNEIFTGEWDAEEKYWNEKNSHAQIDEGTDAKKKSTVQGGDESLKKRHFFYGFRKLKNIFFECQEKLSKRFKKTKSRFLLLKGYFLSLYHCVKVFSFRSLDEFLNYDLIPVTDYVYFVRDGLNLTEERSGGRKVETHSFFPTKLYATHILDRGWTTLVCDRLENLLRTHSLKFQFDTSSVPQGRGRRRDHRMFAMMVMGFMIMASILIPMGFQFLTVLGGKSLLLAKMALIMSAINGLKKIATSNVGYGFYHTGSDGHHHDHLHHGFHEKYFHVSPPNYNNLQGYN